MYMGRQHTDRTREVVNSLFAKGLSAREVAKKANKLCKHDLFNPLTKGAVIGIRNRSGLCVPRGMVYKTYTQRKRNSGYDKSLAFNEHKEQLTFFERRKQRLSEALKKKDSVMFNNPLTGYLLCIGIILATLLLVYLKVSGFTIG